MISKPRFQEKRRRKSNSLPVIRRPTVAGQFYEGTAESLRTQVTSCFLHPLGPKKLPAVNMHDHPRRIVGLVSPHAGYMYSGPVAAHGYYELALDGLPDTVVVMGPNHTGYGGGLGLMREGTWRTPLGDVQVDSALADEILHESRIVDVDELAHRYEHSIEVQLPFLQFLYGDKFKIAPICFQMQDIETATDVGKALVKVLATRNAVVIASSDLTHYEPQKNASAKDHEALEKVINLDVKGFYQVLESKRVTACGFAPIAAAMTYAKGVGVKETRLLSYQTSGDITGDHSSVVGYGSVVFKK